VDLVTNRDTGVGAAAGPVEAALRGEGFAAARQDRTSELARLFPGLGDELAEWHVTAPDGQRTELQLAYFDRSHDPVLMDVGPVLDLQDVAGSKVCALAGRAYSRDYVDTAALLGRWTPAELIGFAGISGPIKLRMDRGRPDSTTSWPTRTRIVSRRAGPVTRRPRPGKQKRGVPSWLTS
jgi:hypothetical protein